MGFIGSCGRPLTAGAVAALSVRPRTARRVLHDGAFSGGVCDGSQCARDGRTCLLFDGRLDNRDDIFRALRQQDRHAPDLHEAEDASLALAAFAAWGPRSFDRLIGDYALAVWEAGERRVWLTTDPGALRTLFFWSDGGHLLFATEQRGLFACPEVPRELDRDQMAAWLCMLPREPLRTFFRNVNRVPPGQSVCWTPGDVALERWWRPEDVPALHLPRDEDYEEALREAFGEAVRARMRPGERIGSHLSGGLDSSSVTAFAARELAGQGRGLTAFTAAPRHPQPASHNRFTDEWPHAAEVAALYPNIEHVRIHNDAEPLLDALDVRELGSDWPVLNASNTVWATAINRDARRRGLDVMMQGAVGNLTISYGGQELLAERLRNRDVPGSLRAMRDLRRGGGRSWPGIAGQVADSLLPLGVRRRLRAAMGKSEPGLFDHSAIRPEFLRGSGVEERAIAMACNLRNLGYGDSRALRLAGLDRGDHRGHAAMATRRLFGLDVRDPTGDRRLVELCLSIPDEQFARGGVPRSLIRRAMRGILPDVVLDERRKGLQSADWRVNFDAALPGLRQEVARLRNSPFASECLDLNRMEALLDTWPGVTDSSPQSKYDYVLAFSRALTAGRFIRRIERGNG
ncbi:asparagine synthetase B family protein [Ancylobacter sp.]|uniref:asparagine synthetase B family protein n=1 Tax=Ancylobacter sp. TaxID=1872567 RepID=UPI003D0A2621